ncbi:MAG: MSMEG_1061 family FMN-dependent PPOX-type flavoprotein [Pseudomonadota bacterium]
MRVHSIDDLEALYPGIASISKATWAKETPVVNDAYRKLIERAPFFAIASIGPDGMDCSPRGDGPGSVHILKERRLAFPDRRGNNRLDTLRNIVSDPRVALLFLIPGWEECLRVNGQAYVTTENTLRERFSFKGMLPASVVVVDIDTMYFQCARAIKRAGLWDEASKQDRATLPTAGELVNSVIQDFEADAYDGALQERQSKTLY